MPFAELSVADLSALVLAVATTISLIYISRQLSVTRRQTKGEFLLALDDQLDKVRDTLLEIVGDRNLQPKGKEWPRVWSVMNVFERISIMVEDKIIDIAIVDRLYGFFLLRLIANDALFQRIKETGADWQDFVVLCRRLARRRRRSGHPHDQLFVERVGQLSERVRALDPFAI